MKKENLNYSEEELFEYEEETLKGLSKEALTDVSGGVSVKSDLWAGGILSMALFGSLNAQAMDVQINFVKSKNCPGLSRFSLL